MKTGFTRHIFTTFLKFLTILPCTQAKLWKTFWNASQTCNNARPSKFGQIVDRIIEPMLLSPPEISFCTSTLPCATSISITFCEHHGKGRNDGQFGLQRHWIDSHTKMFTISSLHELLAALKQQATLTMRTDPPPGGPRYEIIHFHPQKPKEFKYLDAARCDLKIEYTYCLNFARSDRGKYPILMNDFIYSDRASDPSCARRLGPPTLLTKTSEDKDWRVSYRQNQPEKDVLPEDLLRRRLAAQKEAKGNTTSRRLPVLEQLRQQERRYAKQKLKDARERVVFGSADSSSSSSGSSTDTNED